MKDPQSVPTILALTDAISKAEMCQDIFRYIMNDKNMTRIQILEYILSESQSTTNLAMSLLTLYNQQEAATAKAAKENISAPAEPVQTSDTERVIDPEYVDTETPDLTHNKEEDKL